MPKHLRQPRPFTWLIMSMVTITAVGWGVAAAVLPPVDVYGWATFIIGSIIILRIALVHRQAGLGLLAAFCIRTALVWYYTWYASGIIGDVDPDGYWARAVEWSRDGFQGVLRNFTTGAYFYSWVIALLYALTSPSLFMVRELNAILGSLIAWNAYQTANLLWGHKSALRTLWFIAFFPNLILHSALSASREAMATILSLLPFCFF